MVVWLVLNFPVLNKRRYGSLYTHRLPWIYPTNIP